MIAQRAFRELRLHKMRHHWISCDGEPLDSWGDGCGRFALEPRAVQLLLTPPLYLREEREPHSLLVGPCEPVSV